NTVKASGYHMPRMIINLLHDAREYGMPTATSPNDHMKFDVVIVGSGLAGLSVALHLAQSRKVAVISKRRLNDGASSWAQGGIAAVLDSGDTHEEHIADTLTAGAG